MSQFLWPVPSQAMNEIISFTGGGCIVTAYVCALVIDDMI